MDQQQWSRRRPTSPQITWIGIGVVAVLFAAIVVFGGYYFEWKWTGFPKRTPWDWIDLLIVPVVLAIGGYLVTSSQNRATQAAAERRAQDDALQDYLDRIEQLVTDKICSTSGTLIQPAPGRRTSFLLTLLLAFVTLGGARLATARFAAVRSISAALVERFIAVRARLVCLVAKHEHPHLEPHST